ncbi:MAG: recombinase family protein [Myxacorys chilensis ATA2-1-KO14]|jgi:DNA invertase Pin-like site-specific DNA recombinase|nr:recombinase family protein [Myxacorys chilensis ATA2-1-KO14]
MPTPNGRKAVAYLRLSTLEQAKGAALEQQEARLITAGVDEIYSDIDSGDNSARPDLNRLIDDICAGKIGLVRATRWDRLYRNKLDYEYFKILLRNCDVEIDLLDQGKQDLKTASGEMSADMMVLLAAFERNMLRERIKHGFAYRRSKKGAWSRPPLFYEIVNNQYTIDRRPFICSLQDCPDNYSHFNAKTPLEFLQRGQSKADIAQELVDCFLRIRKYRTVLSHLHHRYTMEQHKNPAIVPGLAIFSSSEGLKSWLMNPILRGHTAYLKYTNRRRNNNPEVWELHRDTHPDHKIITDELYETEIKPILEFNSKCFGQPGATFYLTKRVFCNECKSLCQLKGGSGGRKYYACMHSGISCNNHRCTSLSKIDEAIISGLVEKAGEITQYQIQKKELTSERLNKLRKKLEWIDIAPDLEFDKELMAQRQKILAEIDAEGDKTNNTAWQFLLHPEAQKINFWYSLSQEYREVFYMRLVERVFISDSMISVELKV